MGRTGSSRVRHSSCQQSRVMAYHLGMTTAPRSFEEARAMVAGDLGVEMSKYPLRFACAAYFGVPPAEGEALAVNNGTATLLRLKDKPVVLTCSHVLQGYRDRTALNPMCVFQVGDCAFDPVAQLAKEDVALDFAVIEVTEEQAAAIASTAGDLERSFLEPKPWPPASVKPGEFIAFGGYPGELRRATSFTELSFGSFSSGASMVDTVRDDYLVTKFERDFWVQHEIEPEPDFIGGLSGGPAFVLRHSAAAGIMTYEFIGHVYEFSKNYELLYIRLATSLGM